MAYQIIWLPKAEECYQEIIDYLQYKRNDKVITDFINKTNRKLLQIKQKTQNVKAISQNEHLRSIDNKTQSSSIQDQRK